ncbi:nuclear pore complex protein Nup88 [Caerostris extrusa]|uniref:Nuclear pore complex protein Nup88 n=1 Tax=Caerostris extrusa TaxID=172846 RepID=A0AAV4RMM7_CAEEX|nr:nuclear pore complex protein Nup88 [Caerostris extrusa]
MAAVLDQILKKSGMFDILRINRNKYLSIYESKCLVATFEKQVFVWNDAGSCVLTTDLSSEKDITCKKLTLTNPPTFTVQTILFNHIGSLLVLSGNNGVMIYEVPWRYGKFSSKNTSIIGRSWNIAEYLIVYSSKNNVVQIAWHPGSSSSTHLTVLSTDNYLRTYDVTQPQTPQQVIALNPNSTNSYLSSVSKISFSAFHGENSVSFDFGPPVEIQVPQENSSRVTKDLKNIIVWPIYVLRCNGDVYVVKCALNGDSSPPPPAKLIGPLTMHPPSEDNYGSDACYILCLHTVPTCIVIATSSGIMHHCIVLENLNQPPSEKHGDSSWDLQTPSDDTSVALYVFESVEIPLTVMDDLYDVCQPVRLYKDVSSHIKYHGTHISGLHTIAVPFLQALEESLETESLEKLLSEEHKRKCIVEHTICTKALPHMEAIPVIGFDEVVYNDGVYIICILASWEFVCLPIISSYFSSKPHLLVENNSDSKDGSSVSMFGQEIEKSLQRSVCCPYLKSSFLKQNNTSAQQLLDLLCSVTQRYREDYIQRLTTAQALLRSRVKVLMQQKEYQLEDIKKTREEKDSLILGAEHLAEKYEDANSNQQKLLKRIETVLQKLQQKLPYLSNAEINMKDTLVAYEEKLKAFKTTTEQIMKKHKLQQEKMKYNVGRISSDLSRPKLTETQTKHVKELLKGESISELVKSVNSMKKQIGI